VEIKDGHIVVRAETLDSAIERYNARKQYPSWLGRIWKKDQDVLKNLDRVSSPGWLALAMGRKEDDINKSLARLNEKGLVDQLDGFWYRSALGEGVVIDCLT
jgi:hypothetical protein